MKVDLHAHSLHSGFTSTLRLFRSRDCYSTPEDVYRAARARGMDLVTLTDHDSIDGCLDLFDRHPDASDLIMGEEIECRVPDTALRIHLGAFGLTERHHREVQPLRGHVFEAAAYLRSEGVALVLHHPFHFYRGDTGARRHVESLLPLVHAVEVRNATMLPAHNDLAATAVWEWNRANPALPLGTTGGSDAHVLAHVGSAFTEAPGTTASAFLGSLTRGTSRAQGLDGTTGRLAFEIYGVICNYWRALLGKGSSGLTGRQRASGIFWSMLSLPFQFTPLLVTLAQKRDEGRRVARWEKEWR